MELSTNLLIQAQGQEWRTAICARTDKPACACANNWQCIWENGYRCCIWENGYRYCNTYGMKWLSVNSVMLFKILVGFWFLLWRISIHSKLFKKWILPPECKIVGLNSSSKLRICPEFIRWLLNAEVIWEPFFKWLLACAICSLPRVVKLRTVLPM